MAGGRAAGRTRQAESGEEAFAREVEARLGTYIKQAEQALMAAKGAALRPFDLTVPQYSTLMTVQFLPGQSATQLARVARVTQQTMASVLATLEDRGLIERRTSSLHARVKTVHLTDAGAELVTAADEHAHAIETRLADAFTPAERNIFRELATRAIDCLRGELHGP
jgi:DNA-binding MarR family transcriptional regulator